MSSDITVSAQHKARSLTLWPEQTCLSGWRSDLPGWLYVYAHGYACVRLVAYHKIYPVPSFALGWYKAIAKFPILCNRSPLLLLGLGTPAELSIFFGNACARSEQRRQSTVVIPLLRYLITVLQNFSVLKALSLVDLLSGLVLTFQTSPCLHWCHPSLTALEQHQGQGVWFRAPS